jgi:hypothetical protein
VFVLLGVYLDVLGAIGVLERVVAILESQVPRGDVGNHDEIAVALEARLEQMRQLAIAVVHLDPPARVVTAVVFSQGVDAIGEG